MTTKTTSGDFCLREAGMREYSASIICDECGDSQDYTLTGDSKARDELIMLAERSGWECDAEDLCANCMAIREWGDEDEPDMPDEPSGNLRHIRVR